TTVGGASANGIARWNGMNWSPLGIGMNGTVYALSIYNGELIAGGDFTTAGGVGAIRVAKWNGIGWSPLGSGISGCSGTGCKPSVRFLTVYNSELIAGGRFTTAGGISANFIARW